MPKESLKDKLEGNELDLSLNNISTVPVKELASLPKATRLDLSCNLIASLPDTFCDLTHLVKIDLSKNLLTELPDGFGNLQRLEHLDLLGNQLSILPISFWRLSKLKWLDLKDNPLKDDLKKAAGDCLDEGQCKKCATNVLVYMKAINSELERRKQKQLQKQREEEEKQKAEEEAQKEKIRQERKLKKQRQRQEAEENAKLKAVPQEDKLPRKEKQNGATASTKNIQKKPQSSKGCSSIFGKLTILVAFLVLLFAIVIGTFHHCDVNRNNQYCRDYCTPFIQKTQTNETLTLVRNSLVKYYNTTGQNFAAFLEKINFLH